MTAPAPSQRGFDPEAEQDVDFVRYVRLLAVRWWLLAAGVVAGAVIGYLVSLGGTQVYKGTATLYLGQPYAAGNSQVQNLQTNPSAVGTIVMQQQVDEAVATQCGTKVSQFRKGISTKSVSGNVSRNGQNPLVQLSVQARSAKVAECAANGLADVAVKKLGTYPKGKIAAYQAEIATDNAGIKQIQAGLGDPAISSTDKLLLQTQLHSFQQDRITTTLSLQQARQVESPRVITGAAARKVTARSRRNTVVIAALIGLILGALAALLWDRVVPRLVPRNGG